MDYNTILIVDDEEDNLALLYRIFRNKYTILKTTSPIEGLEIIKNNGSRIWGVFSFTKDAVLHRGYFCDSI